VKYKTGDILMVKNDMTYSLCEMICYDGHFIMYRTHDIFVNRYISWQLKDKFIKIGEL
jgi:hypothetical protein